MHWFWVWVKVKTSRGCNCLKTCERHVCMYGCMYVCVCVYVCVCTLLCIFVWVWVQVKTSRVQLLESIRKLCVYVCMYVCMYVCIHRCCCAYEHASTLHHWVLRTLHHWVLRTSLISSVCLCVRMPVCVCGAYILAYIHVHMQRFSYKKDIHKYCVFYTSVFWTIMHLSSRLQQAYVISDTFEYLSMYTYMHVNVCTMI